MKQFNLNEYLKDPSKKVITRDGRAVKIHCTNFNSVQPIIAEIEGHNSSQSFTRDGKYCIDDRNLPYDLFFASEKKEGWLNIYHNESGFYLRGNPYKTKEEAEEVAKANYKTFCTTIKIEWEE